MTVISSFLDVFWLWFGIFFLCFIVIYLATRDYYEDDETDEQSDEIYFEQKREPIPIIQQTTDFINICEYCETPILNNESKCPTCNAPTKTLKKIIRISKTEKVI